MNSICIKDCICQKEKGEKKPSSFLLGSRMLQDQGSSSELCNHILLATIEVGHHGIDDKHIFSSGFVNLFCGL